MKKTRKLFLFSVQTVIVICLFHPYAFAQHKNEGTYPIELNDTYLELLTPGIPLKKVTFKEAYGEWFHKKDDAGASLKLRNGNEYYFEISWDNTDLIQHFTKDQLSEIRRFTYAEFGPDARLHVELKEEDEVVVKIERMDASALYATIDGELSGLKKLDGTGYLKVKVHGRLRLNKDPDKMIITARFGECDPVVYLKVGGGVLREASECEKKFAAFINGRADSLWEPLRVWGHDIGWREITTNEMIHPSEFVDTRYEQKFASSDFMMPHTKFILQDPDVKPFDTDRMTFIQDSLEKEERDKGIEPDMGKILKRVTGLISAETNRARLEIWIQINAEDNYTFARVIKNNSCSGCKFILNTAARFGKSPEMEHSLNLPGVTLIGLGHWKEPDISIRDNKRSEIQLTPLLNSKRSHLSVQSILIRIEGTDEMRKKALELIDLSKLNAIIDQ